MSVTERWTIQANPSASGFLRDGVHVSGYGADAIRVGVTSVGSDGERTVETVLELAEWRELVAAVERKLGAT